MKWIKKRSIGVLLVICFLGSSSLYGAGQEEAEVLKRGGLVKIKNVKCISQFPQLPTGCEATALTMLLNYYDVKVTKEEVADAMPKCDLPYYNKGKWYGHHPTEAFIGNPYSVASYGVFSKVIVGMVEDYCPGRVEDLTGKELLLLLKNIDEGRPVMLWATIGMSPVSYKNSWIINRQGTVFSWPGNEHALLLIGYDQESVYLNDPYTGREQKYPRTLVEKRYDTLGRQAVSITFPIPLLEDQSLKEEAVSVAYEESKEEESQEDLVKQEIEKAKIPLKELLYWKEQMTKEINELVYGK